MSQTVWSHETVLPSDPFSAARAREFVCHRLTDHDLPHLIDDVRLVTSELATNAVIHAQQPFTVTLCGDECLVVLTVRDGSGSAPVHRSAQVMDTRGRGLSIVDSISHDWGVERSTASDKSVWASFEVTRDCLSRESTG
jgi:anti-sigma regulatory factor (Ser/Thr protein kinase)